MQKNLTPLQIAIHAINIEKISDSFPIIQRHDLLNILEYHYRHISLEEIEAILDYSLGKYKTYQEAIDYLTDINRLKIVLGDGTVRIRADAILHWKEISRSLDPDLMITRVLKRNDIMPKALFGRRSIKWGYIPGIHDAFLKTVFEKGLYDIHVHLEGGNPIYCLWLRVMNQIERDALIEEAIIRAKNLNGKYAERLRMKIQSIILQARKERKELIHKLNQAGAYVVFNQIEAKEFDANLCRKLLLQERCMMLSAWYKESIKDIFMRLAKYSCLKNKFIYELLHTPEDNPGLASFRRYFDAPNVLNVIKPSKKREQLHLAWCAERILDSAYLHMAEVRISPFNSIKQYIQFFKSWKTNIKEFKRGEKRIPRNNDLADKLNKTKFVIHFIKKVWMHASKNGNELHEKIIKEHMRLSLQSAALNYFRHKCPEYAQLITGVDVANRERGSLPYLYTPWLRLLRGFEDLENVDRNNKILRPWLALKKNKLHQPSPILRKLGLTFHVGEEFYHPLEGVMNMESVIRGARMQAGDRIGHGLAGGWNIEEFHKVHREVLMPRGIQLDMLVWLKMTMHSLDMDKASLSNHLDEHIMELSSIIYGKIYTAGVLFRLWKDRHILPGKKLNNILDDDYKQLMKEDFLPDVLQKRMEMSPLPECIGEQAPFFNELITRWWTRWIRENGIVVEVNPSSNMSVGNIKAPELLPGVRRALESAGASLSLGSDDPAIFFTNIEHEYALFYEGLLHAGRNEKAWHDTERKKEECKSGRAKNLDCHEAQRIIEHIRHNSEAIRF